MANLFFKNSVKPFHRVTLVLGSAIVAFTMTAAQAETPADQAMPQVELTTTEGKITIQLRPDIAPETVKNFLAYVRDGFYEDTIFHRVIPGFMIQGGGYKKSLDKKDTRPPVPLETSKSARNLRGTIAMARTNDPDSATSQFFINLVDSRSLDAGVRGAGYAVFGDVTEGMGVVDAIAGTPTASRGFMNDVPVTPVIIQSAHVLNDDDQNADAPAED
ncbi:peptidylprolyl isomerase [Marinobacter sp. 1Y8]